MRKTFYFAAIFSLLNPIEVLADWEYTRWGMTPEQVVKAAAGAVKRVPEAKRLKLTGVSRQNAVEGSYTEGTLRLTVAFQFDNKSNGLICVLSSAADVTQNEAFRDWLIKKNGQPQEKGGLPAIGLQEFRWNTPDSIRFELLEGSPFSATQCKPGHEI